MMKFRDSLWRLLSTATVACIAAPALIGTAYAGSMQPKLVVGPAAVPSDQAASNSYGLFSCQLGKDPGVNCYDPYQMRHAYGIDKLISEGYDGTGKTIVIIDAFQNPNIEEQLSAFDIFYGLPAPQFTQIAPQGLTPFDATNQDQVGWAEEISLDVEWAHAIAPGANIVLVLSKSDNDADILAATRYVVVHHLGDVISQSFGEDEACMDPHLLKLQHQLFAQATKRGMTIFASAGDDGAGQINCDQSALVQAVSTPAVDPLVTAVGGTELHAADYTTSNPGAYESESVWNEPLIGSGGGGFSTLYSAPEYQEQALDRGSQRGVPDVTYSAAVLHGVLTYLDIPGVPTGFYLFGGTSAGSPQWSAVTAIADEKNGRDLGFINDALYRIASGPFRWWSFYPWAFNDITAGNNSWLDPYGFNVPGFNAAQGWDAASGLGSPKAPALVDLLVRFVSYGDGDSELEHYGSDSHHLGGGHARPH